MNLYEMEWWAKNRLDEARAFAARQAMVRQALGDRPTVRVWLGALLVRLGTWLQDRAAERDAEAKRVAA